jgi:hypothetical protein
MAALRYVVLHHTGHGEDHFDLMVETSPQAKLDTWRLNEWPIRTVLTTAQFLTPHRREYLTYEGPVSSNRGSVRRVHEGTHQVVADIVAMLTIRVETGDVWHLYRAATSPVHVVPGA